MQIRLAVVNQAGGVGKTTVSATLGALVAQAGYRVALVDLDPQGSLSLFTGTDRYVTPAQSVASVLSDGWDGEWPLQPVWQDHHLQCDLCSGSAPLLEAATSFYRDFAWPFLLRQKMADHPLDHDLVIFDTGATPEPYPLLSVVASTHILIPFEPEIKVIDGFSRVFRWIYDCGRRLNLVPMPTILGCLPIRYNPQRVAMHRSILPMVQEHIPQTYDLKIFDPVRYSTEFYNTQEYGLPLPLFRPNHPAVADFDSVRDTILELLTRFASTSLEQAQPDHHVA